MSNLVETSIPWIGQVPTDWDIKPLFSVATENKTKNKERNENVLSLSYGRIIRRDLSKNLGLLPENFNGYQVVETGYIIIRSTDLQNDKKSLRVGLVKENGVITSAYIGLSPSNTVHPEYLFYYLNMCDLKKVFYSLGGGLRQSLRFEEFKRFPAIVPSIDEQKLISQYLDKKTSQIDSLVEKIQKKIDLLKEQRTSLINHYVTKGLDPNAEMKDSGVEWIGEIPKHWKLSRVKFELNIHNNNRVPLSAEVRGDRQGEYPYYGSTSIIDWVDDYLFDGRFILLAEDGGNLVLRNLRLSFIVEGKFWVNNHAHILKSENDLYDHYYCEFLEQSDFTTFITGSAQPKLTLEAIKTVPVCVPNEDEISEITSELRTIKNQFRKLIEIHEKKIKYLKEYRQSLISSVVTGKVRVTKDMV